MWGVDMMDGGEGEWTSMALAWHGIACFVDELISFGILFPPPLPVCF